MQTAVIYRYNLDASPRKFPCPQCGQKKFVRYLDSQTGQYLPEMVGRCDRENNCGYHFTPKQHFADNPHSLQRNYFAPETKAPDMLPPEFMSLEYVKRSMATDQPNNFLIYLNSIFRESVAKELALKYFIGTSKHIFTDKDFPGYLSLPGATIFWQIDERERLRFGKVMLYDPATGKRVKEPFNHVISAHKLRAETRSLNLAQVFFGQHLLNEFPDKPIGIVESEKTAVICSFFMPQYNWIATGGKNGAKWREYSVYKALEGRRVVLFPDFGKPDTKGRTPFIVWQEIASHIAGKVRCEISVSSLLENHLASERRAFDVDLADLLVKQCPETGLALTDHGYPAIFDYKN